MNTAVYHIREATHRDYKALLLLMDRLDLTTYGLLFPGSRYWVAVTSQDKIQPEIQPETPSRIIGVVGLEPGLDGSALLRSAGVAPDHQNKGIGRALTETAYTWLRANGYQKVYCFSTAAQRYWGNAGYRMVPLTELLTTLNDAPQTRHFDGIGWLPTEVIWRLDL